MAILRQASRPSTLAGVLGLGVAQLLRNVQRILKVKALPHHLGEHEVGGAVHDALHLGDDVSRQALVHGGDDGRTAAHRSLEQEGTVVLLGQRQQLCAVGSHHLLVGGAHAAAALQTRLDVRVSKAGAADGLHHHPDLRVLQDHVDILDHQGLHRVAGKILRVQNIFYLHRFASPAGDAWHCGTALRIRRCPPCQSPELQF